MTIARTRTLPGLVWCSLAVCTCSLYVTQPTQVDNEQKSEAENGRRDANICIRGHLAPEFLLIGSQKAGSSAFAEMLKHPDMIQPTLVDGETDSRYYKEAHIFDEPGRFAKGPDFWLSHYPECIQSKRVIAADFTPDYLPEKEAPHRMKAFYGDENIHRLKLAVILRNPAARIHSAFHFLQHEYRNGGHSWAECSCQERFNNSHPFKSYVEALIQNDDPCYFTLRTDYAQEIGAFLEVFSPSQFTVFPLQEIAAPKDGISMATVAVWQSLGISGPPPKVTHLNSGSHPSLEDDLDATLLEKYQSYISDQIGANKVAKVLIDRGINVFGYEGAHEHNALAAYLGKTW